MFYPARMDRIIFGVHQSWKNILLSSLHSMGEVEIIDIKQSSFDCSTLFSSPPDPNTLDNITHTAFQLDQIIESLNPFVTATKTNIRNLFKKPDDTRLSASDADIGLILKEANRLIEKSQDILIQSEQLKELIEEKTNIDHVIENLTCIEPVISDIRDMGISTFVFLLAGKVQESADGIKLRINELSSDDIVVKPYQTGLETLIICIGMREYYRQVTEIFKSLGVIPILFPEGYHGNPTEQLVREKERQTQIQMSIDTLRESIQKQVQRILPRLTASSEELAIRRGRQDIVKKAGTTRDMFLLEGWVRHKDLLRLESLLKNASQNEFFLFSRPATADEDVPVLYDNPYWLKPFELLTTTFARPRYNEIDPTPFFAPAFLIFFGLMLGDAGYGVIIALAGLLVIRVMGNNQLHRDMGIILTCTGIADIICGTIQGGWFGDLLPRFFGITPPFILIEPLKSPIVFFQIALIIGTLHLNLGLFIALWENIRNHAYKNAFQGQVIWFILQPAAAILLVSFFGWMTISSNLLFIAGVAAILSLVVLFYSQGPMGFFSLTGFLGDWLSYVRILALALATGGIAMTINLLTGIILSISPYLLIPAIIFCILGQTFNLAIQTLGSIIHALRLHYIEFFGKFYSGGGRAFLPFKEDRIHTKVTNKEHYE